MYKCPHCGEPGVSKLRKLSLGPGLPTTCQVCGKKVGIPYWSMLVYLPFILLTVLSINLFESLMVKIAIFIVILLLISIIQMLWIPLERR